MKIAVIGHKRVPSREGGIEKTVEKQMLRLAERGHEVIFYNRSGHNIFGESFDAKVSSGSKSKNIKIETVFTPNGKAAVPVYSFLATRKALKEHCSIIFYHGSGSCNMIPLAKRFGAKCAAMLHGIDSKRDKWGRFGRFYLEKGEKAAAKKADACFVLSGNMQEYMKKRYGADTLRIFNGAEPPAAGDHEKLLLERFGLKKDQYILTLVRIVPEKGLHYLIKAFKKCRTDKKLVIAGGVDPACRDYYEKLLGLAKGDDRIVFTGYVEEPYVSSLYLGAYFFVLPSNLEGMAHCLLEAMAAGCCCLVSDIPENTEVLGNYGLSFKKADVSDLAKKMQKLFDDPALVNKFRSGVSDYVLDNFRWERCADILEKDFMKILVRQV